MHKISIIIPTLKEADCIQQTLSHLQLLRQRGHEVILVDGGSEDDTLALAAGLIDQCIKCKPGRAQQMNAGAKLAKGDLLLFLHADTWLPDDADKIIFSAKQRRYAFWGRFDVRFDDPLFIFKIIAFCMNWRSRLTGIATGDQAIFVSRSLFHSSGSFPRQPLMEDIELSKRLRKQLRPLCLSAKAVTSSRRWRRRGIVRTILLMWRLRFAYYCGTDPSKMASQYTNR
ncbi:MAG: TIGR04283 family arsenosugar biosynthesis glycosyltransferase [Gammaproteobacteria bacterium]|nr:TIGR04283 family arsenosugar biosynthesis glycosyltransferase [Gammaproteobacteria bacterium]